MKTWGFIGAGKMASALVHGMLRAEIAPANAIFASDPLPAARSTLATEAGITVFESNLDVVKHSNVLVLAVKPQSMNHVLAELRPVITPEHLVVSIAAGITIESIVHGLGRHSRVIRVMPNTPALVGEGISAFAPGGGVAPKTTTWSRRSWAPWAAQSVSASQCSTPSPASRAAARPSST